MIAAFVIWTVLAVIFAVIGIRCRSSKRAVGFFANSPPPEVRDIAGYNRAVSSLWLGAALIFELFGVPFLFLKQNSPLFLFPVLGCVFWSIGLIITYLRILDRYGK